MQREVSDLVSDFKDYLRLENDSVNKLKFMVNSSSVTLFNTHVSLNLFCKWTLL